ncbi:hypothetical protein WMF30_45445 [Sorangium sp. So ce134]
MIGDPALLPDATPWFGGASNGEAGGLGVPTGEVGALVVARPTLAPWFPAVVLPEGFPDVAAVALGELVLLTLFRVTGSQPEKVPGFGVGLWAAAWFTALGVVALLDGRLASDEGCAKLPELFAWARSSDRMALAGDGERLRDDLMDHE